MAYSEARLELLTELSETAPITCPDLARNLQQLPSTVHSMLRRLEREGLVESDKYQRPTRIWFITSVGTDAIKGEP